MINLKNPTFENTRAFTGTLSSPFAPAEDTGNSTMVGNENATTEMWQYTWEAQSHTPTLRLLLFAIDVNVNPSLQCHNLSVNLLLSRSVIVVTWSDSDPDGSNISVRVPVPKGALVDGESPVSYRSLTDHIEVKLRLLLPVNHPMLSAFDSVLNLSEEQPSQLRDGSRPLVMESDVKILSSRGEVDFYCRRCLFKLNTNPLRNFVEMPSTNWREVADNWFGACCCSFGGISEKLVIRYVNSYSCKQGKCLLSSTSVTLCKDDLVEYNFPEGCELRGCNSVEDNLGDGGSICSDAGEMICNLYKNSRFALPENEKLSVTFKYEVTKNKPDNGDFSNSRPDVNGAEDVAITPSCCGHKISFLEDEHNEHYLSETAGKEQIPTKAMEILGNKKSFLNGFLEDTFMARSSNLSKDIDWHEFTCPQCMTVLGAYPCCEGHTLVDGGVRLFKCYISTCVPVGGSGDLFSKYTVERMFANQLVECANDESSYRFLIRDLKTRSPALQIVLLNQDTWFCFGNCSGTEDKGLVPKLQLQPIIKVLFSDCCTATETQLRMIEDWATKNSAENIFMLTHQIQELASLLMSAKDKYPPSCASLQSLILSSLQR